MTGLVLSSFLAFAAFFGPSLEGEVPAERAPSEEDTGVVSCSDQYLEDGQLLPDLPLFYTRTQPDASWGTPEMIEVIVETGRHMRWLMPESSPVLIGDISREHGGSLSGHISHRGGIDADVGLYKTGAKQHARGFTPLGPGEFDVEANWALITAMLDTGLVDFILLDRSHVAQLRAYGLKAGLLTEEEADRLFPAEGTRGVWENTGIVRHAPNHYDHLHLRVVCGTGARASGT